MAVKTYTATVGKIDYLSGMHCIELTATVMKALGPLKKKRLLCNLNGKTIFSCGILSAASGRGMIMLNKKQMKIAGCQFGDRIKIQFTEDASRYGMPMPEELEEVLRQDEYGSMRFDKLTPGKKRNIIHFVNSVKSSSLRIERALKLINNLKSLPEGKEKAGMIFGAKN